MITFDGFEKLSIPTKGIAFGILFQLPFWLLSIYLFNYDLYFQRDYLILTCLCLALAIAMTGINIALAGVALLTEHLVLEFMFHRKFQLDELFVYTSILSTMTLSLSISVCFVINSCCPMKYWMFLLVAFALDILIPFIYVRTLARRRKKELASSKTSEK